MKIQSVAILGAGAVGCYVLWGLADKAAANTLQLGDEMAKSLGVKVPAPSGCDKTAARSTGRSITRRSGPRSRPTASIC